MSVYKDWLDVIRTVLILLEAIIVLVWMDMNWNQIITLVQVIIIIMIVFTLIAPSQDTNNIIIIIIEKF